MNEKRDASSASLYRLSADLDLVTVLGDITISNGLAWSPDGRTMYHADTPARIVRAYDFDSASGTPSNRRVFAQFEGETDRPDGATVDSEGCYWCAFYGGGKVVRLSPQGKLLAEHPVPAMCPTMARLAAGNAQLCMRQRPSAARPMSSPDFPNRVGFSP
jgi:sugar lactone lactonase YvrE